MKHGAPLGETPSSYLKIVGDLLKINPTEENACDMHRKGGWTLYVNKDRTHGKYVRSLHLKKSHHERYLAQRGISC
uniref:Fork-head domain-containing protein n=1 Tax=Steinernema glaseri TaxID=37863 RepID=A0A1I7ZPI3_9BILA